MNDCNVIRRAKQRFTNNSCNFKSSDGDIRDDLNLMNANVKIKISKQLRLILEHKYLSFFSFYVYTTCCLYRNCCYRNPKRTHTLFSKEMS